MRVPARRQEVAPVLAVLTARPRPWGLAPAALVPSLEPVAAAVALSVERGEKDPDGALQDLLEKSTNTFNSGVRGWMLAADKLDQLPFPEELLAAQPPHIAIGVAHFRPKGSPWGARGALIVTGASGMMVARASRDPREET